MLILFAFLIGVVAGLRAMTAPAAVALGAWLGWIDVSTSWAWFMGSGWTVIILSVAAIAELISDQLPSTPSRKVPVQFGTRIVSGGFCGAVLGAMVGAWPLALVAGVVGAVAGTYGGAAARGQLAAVFGRDLPAALIEDVVAIGLALIVVWAS
ncbi:MAG: DUF4126 family protein [Cypionkella sp.]